MMLHAKKDNKLRHVCQRSEKCVEHLAGVAIKRKKSFFPLSIHTMVVKSVSVCHYVLYQSFTISGCIKRFFLSIISFFIWPLKCVEILFLPSFFFSFFMKKKDPFHASIDSAQHSVSSCHISLAFLCF